MKILGGAIFAVGVGLFIGNVTHTFPTFPLAGWLTMAIGGFVIRSGS